MSHTPGPWAIERIVGVQIVSPPNGHPTSYRIPVAELWINESTNANARLIAAAPELLAALETLVRACAEDRWPKTAEHMMPLTQARAAIAKAKGEA